MRTTGFLPVDFYLKKADQQPYRWPATTNSTRLFSLFDEYLLQIPTGQLTAQKRVPGDLFPLKLSRFRLASFHLSRLRHQRPLDYQFDRVAAQSQ